MTTVEQILLKLGIDQSQVGPGLSSFEQKVNEATGHAHKSFLHAESGGRAFHKMLHEITQASPLAGTAIRLALDPVVAVIMAGVMAFKAFQDAQKEAAAEAVKAAKEVREAWVNAQEAIYSKDPRGAFSKRTESEAKELVTNPQESPSNGKFYLNQQGKVIGIYFRNALRQFNNLFGMGDNSSMENPMQPEMVGEDSNGPRGLFASALARGKHAENLKEQKKEAAESAKIYREAHRNEQEARGKELSHEQIINKALADRQTIISMFSDEGATQLEQAKAALEISKLDKTVATERKELAKEKAEAEKKAADELDRGQKIAAQVQFRQQMMAEQQFSSYQPTIHELAGSRTNTPWAREARYIEWLEAGARAQVLWGNVAGAKETVKEVTRLKQQLEDLGLIKPELSTQKMEELLEVLSAAATRDGIMINPRSLD